MAMMNSALGDSLVANGEMSEEECNRALQECQNADVPFVQYIVDNKIIESSKLLEFCEKSGEYRLLILMSLISQGSTRNSPILSLFSSTMPSRL